MQDFGVIYNARQPFETLRSVQLADKTGFKLAGTYDSHFLWQEPWIYYAIWAVNTTRISMGPFVTNPLTRHITVTASLAATLYNVLGGRTFVGIGRGDSAVRTMSKKPASLDVLERSVKIIRNLTSGDTAEIEGTEVRLPWATGRVPIYVAAYGPKALQLAGKVGDGVILQIADAEVIKWSLDWVRKGARSVDRDLHGFEVISAAAWYITGDIAKARKEVRWFPAMVSNHALDLLHKYPKEKLPQSLIRGMEKRGSYDYWEHAKSTAHHLGFVTDEMIDGFSVIGTPEKAISRLEDLWKAGVTTAIAYVLSEDFQQQTKVIAEDIVSKYKRSKRVKA
jgi:probable F420-dependent oxidoreductase